MTKTSKIFLISTAVLLLVGCVFLVFGIVNSQKANKESVIVEEQPTGPIPFPKELAMSLSQTTSSTTDDGRSKFTVQATLTPADAYNQLVDWSVAWSDGASRSSENVTDYVIVTPESDGSLIATVECLKAFYGDTIIVTVTTRDGGYTASCECTYTVIPSALSCKLNSNLFNTEDKAYYLHTYTYDISLEHVIAHDAEYDMESNGYNVSYTFNNYYTGLVPTIIYESLEKRENDVPMAQDVANISEFAMFEFNFTSDGAELVISDFLEDAYYKDSNGNYVFIDMQALVQNEDSNLVITCDVRDNLYNELAYTFDFVVVPEPKLDLSQFGSEEIRLSVGKEYNIPIIYSDGYRNFDFDTDMGWLIVGTETVPCDVGYCSISLFEDLLFEYGITGAVGEQVLVVRPKSTIADVRAPGQDEGTYVEIMDDMVYSAVETNDKGYDALQICYIGFDGYDKIFLNFDIVSEIESVSLSSTTYSFAGTGVEEVSQVAVADIAWGTTYGSGDYLVETSEYLTYGRDASENLVTGLGDFEYSASSANREFGLFVATEEAEGKGYFSEPNALMLKLKNLSSGKTKLSFSMIFQQTADEYYCFPSVSDIFMKPQASLENIVFLFNMTEEFAEYIDEDFVATIGGSTYLKVSFDIVFDFAEKTYSVDVYDANGKCISSLLELVGKNLEGSFSGITTEYIEFKYQIADQAAYNCLYEIAFNMIDLSYSCIEG